jgi:hypothetical protein
MQVAVADFVFDLNDCTRRSLNAAEVAPLYDVKFRYGVRNYSEWLSAPSDQYRLIYYHLHID